MLPRAGGCLVAAAELGASRARPPKRRSPRCRGSATGTLAGFCGSVRPSHVIWKTGVSRLWAGPASARGWPPEQRKKIASPRRGGQGPPGVSAHSVPTALSLFAALPPARIWAGDGVPTSRRESGGRASGQRHPATTRLDHGEAEPRRALPPRLARTSRPSTLAASDSPDRRLACGRAGPSAGVPFAG